jgi:hypothetical protein
MPTVKPLVVYPDEGETFTIGELRIVSRVQGGQSGGELELYELVLDRFVIDYHVHHTMDETLCVIEGQVEFIVADKVSEIDGLNSLRATWSASRFQQPGPGSRPRVCSVHAGRVPARILS